MDKKITINLDPKSLELSFTPAQLQELIEVQCLEAYAMGRKDGKLEEKNKNKNEKFDPAKHVDNSLYAYTTEEALRNLTDQDVTLFARRPENLSTNRSKTIFCKITPMPNDTEVKHG